MAVGQRQAGGDRPWRFSISTSDEAQLRLLAFALAIQLGIGIGGRSIGVVRALLAMEVRTGIAPPFGPWPRQSRRSA